MNTPDQDTVLRALEDARRILGEYIAPGPRDATRTVEQLLAVLDGRARLTDQSVRKEIKYFGNVCLSLAVVSHHGV